MDSERNLLSEITSEAAEAPLQTVEETSGKAKKVAIHITEDLRPIVIQNSGEDLSTLLGWKPIPQNVGRWKRGCSVYHRKNIFLIGGDYEYEPKDDVYALDLERPERGFRVVEYLKRHRLLSAAVVYKGQIRITGGYNKDYILNSCESLISPNTIDDEVMPNICKLIEARYSHSMLVYEGFLYVLGGIGAGKKVLRSVERYNESSWTWEKSTPMQYPRAEFSIACTNNNKIFLVGGSTNPPTGTYMVDVNKIHMLDVLTGIWTQILSPPFIKVTLAGFVMEDGYLHVFGKIAKSLLNTAIVRYKIESGTWERVALLIKEYARPWSLVGIEDIDVSGEESP